MSRNQKTFRPKKNAPSGNKGVQLKKHIDAALGSGNLRDAVRLPPEEDLNEWLAVNSNCRFLQPGEHLVWHFDGVLHTNYMSNNVSRTQVRYIPSPRETCSLSYKILIWWADGVQIKKPIEVISFICGLYLTICAGTQFPQNFKDIVKTIFKRLFRVYAHIYHSHFQKIVNLKEEAHLNTCFKHFTLFTWSNLLFMQEFKLIDKAELAPLIDLIESIVSVC
ncbi:hypothetical protein HU200_007138 [Digitaria exilis]|uniref:Uncharacterized protein n=1 Tax=Digitaria exilis TaxID=1010633 RepID=A0A835KSH3_9POAL|nr:hypothetical protein HU200_007138 [Digitaria exilis]